MKVALQVLAYDVDRYINPMLANIAPWVDKVYLAYPPRPFSYIPSSRESRTNPTRLESIDLSLCKAGAIEVVNGDWPQEEDTRNDCLERAKAEGFDWMIVQDADEFYTEEAWARLYKSLLNNPTQDAFKTTWFTFWKSCQYVLTDKNDSIKGTCACFALRCAPNLKFTKRRGPNTPNIRILDQPCYHYGYVASDEEMLGKVTSWSHSAEFDGPKWYRLKWTNWSPDTRNLNPIFPTSWPKATRFPLSHPEFADPFDLPIDLSAKKRSFEERMYDAKAEWRTYLRSLKG